MDVKSASTHNIFRIPMWILIYNSIYIYIDLLLVASFIALPTTIVFIFHFLNDFQIYKKMYIL
jgi:hypothetical protein